MFRIKKEWCEVLFLRIMFIAGGVILILIPAAKLDRDSFVSIVLGIMLIIVGNIIFAGKERESLKKKQKKNREIRDDSAI